MAGEVGPSGDAGAKGEAVCNNLNRNERFYTCVNIAWARLQYMCDYMRLAHRGRQACWGTVWGRLGVFLGLPCFPPFRIAGKGAFELPFSADDGVESCGFYPLSRGVQLFLTILLF